MRCGGGRNHRFGLDDAVLIKDNHLVARRPVRRGGRARPRLAGHLVKIEVEVARSTQLDEALAAGADVVLLDNIADRRRCATRSSSVDGRALLEASGGITAATVRGVAETGVDLISVGWITHSAPALDVALDFD